MAQNEIQLTMIGNLTADPELRFTPSGAAVANFTIAQTPRVFDKATSEWRDGEATFIRCNVWRQQAEHVAESLQRGMRVVCLGTLRQRGYETREGEKRVAYEMTVTAVGPSLEFATAKVSRAGRSVPWGGQAGFTDEPPFVRAPEAWERGEGLAV
jgi:single-strand DNA-binding protein